MKNKKCPLCGKEIKGYPALSRKDNKTEICSDCGVMEGLNAIFITKRTLKLKEDFKQIIKSIAKQDYCLDTSNPCETCPLNMFDNEDTPCAKNAKELLSLLGVEE